MTDRLIENLQRIIKERRLDYKNVSLGAGLGETYVRDIIAGRVASPTQAKLAKLANRLNLTVSQLTGEYAVDSIPVIGYVDGEDKISLTVCDLLQMHALDDEEIKEKALELVALPPGTSGEDKLFAIRLHPEAVGSIDPPHSLTYIKRSKIIYSNFDLYLGKRVIVQTIDGSVFKRELDKGIHPNTYTLLDIGGRNHIKNIKITAAAPVYCTVYPE